MLHAAKQTAAECVSCHHDRIPARPQGAVASVDKDGRGDYRWWRRATADGFLMPAKKDQAPPDLRCFKPSQK
jgi:hypothetical protein